MKVTIYIEDIFGEPFATAFSNCADLPYIETQIDHHTNFKPASLLFILLRREPLNLSLYTWEE